LGTNQTKRPKRVSNPDKKKHGKDEEVEKEKHYGELGKGEEKFEALNTPKKPTNSRVKSGG